MDSQTKKSRVHSSVTFSILQECTLGRMNLSMPLSVINTLQVNKDTLRSLPNVSVTPVKGLGQKLMLVSLSNKALNAISQNQQRLYITYLIFLSVHYSVDIFPITLQRLKPFTTVPVPNWGSQPNFTTSVYFMTN